MTSMVTLLLLMTISPSDYLQPTKNSHPAQESEYFHERTAQFKVEPFTYTGWHTDGYWEGGHYRLSNWELRRYTVTALFFKDRRGLWRQVKSIEPDDYGRLLIEYCHTELETRLPYNEIMVTHYCHTGMRDYLNLIVGVKD